MRARFAPSPTGELHIGHAYSALTAWKAAGQSAELFCLRIDDLDHTRCRPAYTKQIKDDLSWLGLQWAETPLVQSKRLQRYAEALEKLKADKLLYTRAGGCIPAFMSSLLTTSVDSYWR